MNLVMLMQRTGHEIYVCPEHVESIENAAGGKESILVLKSGQKRIVMGNAAQVLCR